MCFYCSLIKFLILEKDDDAISLFKSIALMCFLLSMKLLNCSLTVLLQIAKLFNTKTACIFHSLVSQLIETKDSNWFCENI